MSRRRRPEDCRHRVPQGSDADRAKCRLVAQLTGAEDHPLMTVPRAACDACCQSLAEPEAWNPVIASLVFRAADEIVRLGGVPGCSADRGRALREQFTDHLHSIHPSLADRVYPPAAAQPDGGERHIRRGSEVVSELRWQVGMLTAPRGTPRIQETLASVEAAGFGPVWIFAEPGSWIPPEARHHRVTIHAGRLGNLMNFYNALSELYHTDPEADCYAIFQDDVRAAHGARAWCDAEFWPHGSGIVSLFTPRLHRDRQRGWTLRSPGFHRMHGAQALVFRRDMLELFLADPHVVGTTPSPRHWDDRAVGGWAAANGFAIAFHTPSLVQHTGLVSSLFEEGPDPRGFAEAVESVDQLASWQPPPRRRARVGLVGWHVTSGVGLQNHDLTLNLSIERWLVPQHQRFPLAPRPGFGVPMTFTPGRMDPRQLRGWLAGLDWILFVERPYVENLVQTAWDLRVRVACVPNWELLHANDQWLRWVDLMICPTRHTAAHMRDWKRRYGFGWEIVTVPWPVDIHRFRFQPRSTCRRFVFVNGWGGTRGRRLDGSLTEYHRKGLELIANVARAAPEMSFLVYSQQSQLPDLPANVECRSACRHNDALYAEGDVCVQPSHWEGLGLQLLECQAAGMPLITTDAPPMNEYQPLDVIPVTGYDVVQLWDDQPIVSRLMAAGDCLSVLQRWWGQDISKASRRAREFVEREHSWAQAARLIEDELAV